MTLGGHTPSPLLSQFRSKFPVPFYQSEISTDNPKSHFENISGVQLKRAVPSIPVGTRLGDLTASLAKDASLDPKTLSILIRPDWGEQRQNLRLPMPFASLVESFPPLRGYYVRGDRSSIDLRYTFHRTRGSWEQTALG